MKAKSNGIILELTFEEAVVLNHLLGNLSKDAAEVCGLEEDETDILRRMFWTLSAYLPNEEDG